MPLKKGKSKKIISQNISELITSKPGSARKKGIATLARRTGMTLTDAKRRQAIAIAIAKSKRS